MQSAAFFLQPLLFAGFHIRPVKFIEFAAQHLEMTFLVTRIGCGIAGFTPMEIAPLFARAIALPNVWLPKDFWKILNR